MTRVILFGSLTAGLLAVACTDTDPTRPGASGAPAVMALVSGDSQTGRWGYGEELHLPFVVRVTDAAGRPLRGARVDWDVVSGSGVLLFVTRTTNADGQALGYFKPGGLGTSIVTARVGDLAPAVFTTSTTIAVITIDWPAAAFIAPDGSTHLSVPAGTTVEWADVFGVASLSAPPGGEFASGLLSGNERFSLWMGIPGTWEYSIDPALVNDSTCWWYEVCPNSELPRGTLIVY